MKKIISLILCLLMCTVAVSAAVPESYKDRELAIVSIRGESNIDGATGTNYGTINFDGVSEGFVTRMLKNPDNPDDYCLQYKRTAKDGSCRFFTPDAKAFTGIWALSFDFMRGSKFSQSFSIKLNGDWLSAGRYDITTAGDLKLGSNVAYSGMEDMHWYNITFMYDTITDKTWTIVKDLESEEPAVESEQFSIMKDGAPVDIKYVNYIECNISGSDVNTKTFYVDSIVCAMLAYKTEVSLFGVNDAYEKNDDGIDYNSAKFALKFSEAIDEDTIPENAVTLSMGDKNIPVTYSYDESENTIFAETEEILLPNTEYSVSVASGIKTLYGLTLSEINSSLKTIKQPYGINKAVVSEITAEDEFTVSVEINNREAVNKENIIFVMAYDSDGALCSINATKTSGTTDKITYPVTLKAPAEIEGMKLKVIFTESLLSRTLIDVLEVE